MTRPAARPHRRAALAALALGLLAAPLLAALPAAAQERFITLASTTSTEQSGLFGHLLPIFRAANGIEVRVVAVGTGQALALAARGDADALLVHDREGELKFVAEGHGLDRRPVMHNDFVLVGPAADPAGARGLPQVAEALRRVAAAGAPFVSRGDDSGTHRAERRLWTAAGVALPAPGGWYREVGQGMGPTLTVAGELRAYALTDRSTLAAHRGRTALEVLVQGDAPLLNPYASILVNPAKGAFIKAADARAWHEWLTSAAGRAAIAAFKVNGEQLFFPAAPGGAS